MSIAVRTEPNNEWIKHWAQEWQKQHPEVALKIVDIAYADMAKKQLAELATDTMQDVVYSGVKWFDYSALNGAFPAGQIAHSSTGIYVVLSLGKTVADKFKWDAVLFPKGPIGLRGYEDFAVMWSIYAKSKHPEPRV